MQPGDDPPTPFSFLHLQQPGWAPPARQVPCHGTRTTAETERVVAECMALGGAVRHHCIIVLSCCSQGVGWTCHVSMTEAAAGGTAQGAHGPRTQCAAQHP